MSRIGRLPIPVPKGVEITLGDVIHVKGPKGELSQPLVEGVTITQDGDELVVTRASDSRDHRARHGLMRALLNNMVIGVTRGFERKLDIVGVGYKAEVKDIELTQASFDGIEGLVLEASGTVLVNWASDGNRLDWYQAWDNEIDNPLRANVVAFLIHQLLLEREMHRLIADLDTRIVRGRFVVVAAHGIGL